MEIPQAVRAAEGVALELEDCAFRLLAGINITDDAIAAFDGVDVAMLVSARIRTRGMANPLRRFSSRVPPVGGGQAGERVDVRRTSLHAGLSSGWSSVWLRARRAQVLPWSRSDWTMVIKPADGAELVSSHPETATSSGTRRPRWAAARSTPRACSSLMAAMASGASGALSRSTAAS